VPNNPRLFKVDGQAISTVLLTDAYGHRLTWVESERRTYMANMALLTCGAASQALPALVSHAPQDVQPGVQYDPHQVRKGAERAPLGLAVVAHPPLQPLPPSSPTCSCLALALHPLLKDSGGMGCHAQLAQKPSSHLSLHLPSPPPPPPSFLLCIQVTTPLRLSDLRLHTRHLPDLRSFTGVRELNLANNKLGTIVGLGLTALQRLELLDVQNNNITSVDAQD
jgi:hypothetical protein